MNEPVVTLTGNLGADPERIEAGEAVLARFRVGCTPRHFDKEKQDWVDGDTQWFTVKAWRRLGENVLASLRTGDPVVVQGRLLGTEWTTRSGMKATTFEVDAMRVGHDLARGTATFERAARTEESVEAVVDAQQRVPATVG